MSFKKSLDVALALEGVNQSDLAKGIDVSKSYICKLRSGDRVVTDDLLSRICTYLNIGRGAFNLLGANDEN